MSKNLKKKRTMSRQDAAEQMIAIGNALSASGEQTFELGGEAITVSIPDELKFELELEKHELEIELKWKRTSSGQPADDASNESPAAPSYASEEAPPVAEPDRVAQ
jgi:amphi-Trp domain-containing protein